MPNPTPPDEELKNQIIQFQKDTLAEWDNPLGRNVDMIKLAYKFAALIHDREAKAERRAEERLHPLNLFKGVKGVTHYQIRLYGDDKWLLDTLLYDVHTQLLAQPSKKGAKNE